MLSSPPHSQQQHPPSSLIFLLPGREGRSDKCRVMMGGREGGREGLKDGWMDGWIGLRMKGGVSSFPSILLPPSRESICALSPTDSEAMMVAFWHRRRHPPWQMGFVFVRAPAPAPAPPARKLRWSCRPHVVGSPRTRRVCCAVEFLARPPSGGRDYSYEMNSR